MLRKLAGVIACALALTLGAATTAQAATLTLIDGPGDVWEGAGPRDPINFKPHRVPEREQGDILRTTITHAQRQLEIRTRFAELARKGRTIELFAWLRTDTGLLRKLSLRAGVVSDWRVTTTFIDRQGDHFDCAISHRLDYATNVADIRLPRSCLDNPRTLQVSFLVHTGSTLNPFWDNPHNHHLPKSCGDCEFRPPYSAHIPVG